nr:putative ribonuclease H-like domain-containing protein [Tanacetum cinerariifolium]
MCIQAHTITTISSSNTHNVAFMSAENTSSTNDVSTAYSVSSLSVSKSQKEGSSSYTDEVIHSFFANQLSAPQLDYDGLEQINDDDMEEMDLKWQIAMISMRIKKFHKKTGRKLQFDTKDPVGFDKTKVECFNFHKMRHFARDCRAKRNQDSRIRDDGYNRNKTRDNGRKLAYQDDSKALVTIDGEDIDWSGHVEEDAQNYAMMAYSFSNLGSDNEVKSCSKACEESYARLKKLYDDQRDKLGDASVEITAYTLALKKASDLEDTPINDRFINGMHAVPLPITGNYMPSGLYVEIDYSKFTYETSTSMPEPVENASKVVCKPKVWTDAPIIEEYESDSDNDSVSNVQEDKEKPSFAFTDSVKHDRNGHTRNGLGNAFTRKACFVYGSFSHLIRDYDFHEKRMAKQVALTKSKNKVTGQRENRPVWNNVQRINHQNKHMTRNKAYLADYQEFKGGSIAFGGSNGRITGKGKIKTGRLDFEDVYYVEELKHYNLFSLSQMCDKKNKGNLVRGLPSNIFENDHTCVACQKGKQHKASWIKREYSNARTPQQNGVAERKNRTLIKATRTMLADSFLPITFWAETVNTAFYVLNKVLVTKPQNKTPYEILTGKQPIISYLRPFGYHVTILNTIDQLGKFDGKSDLGFLVGYSLKSKAFRVFVLDYLTNSMHYEHVLVENQANKSACPKEANNSTGTQANDNQGAYSEEIDLNEEHFLLPIWSAYSTNVRSSGDKIEKNTGFKTCEKPVSQVEQVFLEDLEKLKRHEKEANDAAKSLRKEATHDIHNANTSSTNLINTTSTPISTAGPSRAFIDGEFSYHDPSKYALPDDPSMPHLEDIYASPSEGIFTNLSYDEGVVTDFNNLETNVSISPSPKQEYTPFIPKLKFLEILKVYVSQPPGFVDPMFPNKVYKVVKALYSLQQAPRACVKTASTPIVTQKALVKDEEAADVDVTLKTSHLYAVKRIFRYLKGQPKFSLWYPKVSSFNLEAYSDSDYAGANLDRKSKTEEYVAIAHFCGQVLWIQNQLLDYGFNFMNTKIYIDNESIIFIVKNPVFHSKTKHIEIRHHFIRDAYDKKLIQVLKIHTDDNVADLLTKAFDVSMFNLLFTMSNTHQELASPEANSFCKELASPKQTALGKDISNPLMAGRLSKTTLPTRLLAKKNRKKNMSIKNKKGAVCKNGQSALLKVNAASLKLTTTKVSAAEKGTSCLANAEIFDGLTKMGYEKLSEKLTFYKAFFSPQWKFMIHTLLQCLSAKTNSWNEFSSTIASTIICLATNQKFNFSRYILLSLVKNIEAGVPFFMFPRFVKLIIDHQLGDKSHHKDIYDNPSFTKKVFSNMKRVGTGFSGVVTALFDNILVLAAKEVGLIQDDVQSIPIPTEPSTSKPHKKHKSKKQQPQAPKVPSPEPSPEQGYLHLPISHSLVLEGRVDKLEEENRVLKELHSVHSKVDTVAPVVEKDKSFKYGRIIADIEKGLSMQDVDDEEPAEVEEVLEVVAAAKLITKVVTTARATTTTEATKVSVLRRRRGVVIQDPEETTSTVVVHSENMAGYKMNYFKRMTYSEIRPLFKKHYYYNQAFLEEVNEEVTVPEKEVEVEGHKREEATPLASNIPIVDYKIHLERNRPYFKIIRVDGKHMLFLSFSTLLKNFDREDLESLWKLVKERFEKTEPKNYTDDYLLKTLKTMFEQPDVKASVWREQKGRYRLAKRYPSTHFTPEQMLNNVRLEVEEESEMSLELLTGGLLGITDSTYYYCSSYLVLLLGITAGIVSTGSVIVNVVRHIS